MSGKQLLPVAINVTAKRTHTHDFADPAYPGEQCRCGKTPAQTDGQLTEVTYHEGSNAHV